MPNRTTRLDWIDAMLFAVGFALVAVVAMVLSARLHVDVDRGAIRVAVVVLGFGPMALRRALFGPPDLPPPREGALWSLLSMLALLAVLFGTGALALATFSLGGAFASPPDFDERARELVDDAPVIRISVVDPSESAAARAEREAREAAAERERQLTELAAIERTSWEDAHAASLRRGMTLALAGALLIAVGATLLKLRYPRADIHAR